MLEFSKSISDLWSHEKKAAAESIAIAKKEALIFLSNQRERIMKMTHEEALKALIKVHKIESRIKVIQSISDNGLLNIR